MIDHYRVEIFWDDDSAAFITDATDLPGCSAASNTRREALDELQDAMLSWLQANAAMGRKKPSLKSTKLKNGGNEFVRSQRL